MWLVSGSNSLLEGAGGALPLSMQLADLIGSVDGLPADLSAHKKNYLRSTGYGKIRSR